MKFADVSRRGSLRLKVFKIVKRIINHQNIIGPQFKTKKPLLNRGFLYDKNTRPGTDIVSDVPCLANKGMIINSISKMKNERAA